MKYDNPEDILQLTAEWKGDRFSNGRPKVSDEILRRMERIKTEEAWGVLWEHGYKYQFQGDWKTVHPGKIMVGRAVTAVMVPTRPDMHNVLLEYGHKEEGRKGFYNSWVIELLQEGDVLVVDMFDKVWGGTFVGGNLSTAVSRRTKNGGQIIWGGIRDLQQVMGIDNIQTYYRGNDPTPIMDVIMTGMNVPCRIGNAICLPGDIVLGTPSGVLFIPPQLAEEVCAKSEKVIMRDQFGFERVRSGVYTTAQIDSAWSDDIWEDFHVWRKENTPPEFQYADWSHEEEDLRKRQAGNPTTV